MTQLPANSPDEQRNVRQLSQTESTMIRLQLENLTSLVNTRSTEIDLDNPIPEELLDKYYNLLKESLKWLKAVSS